MASIANEVLDVLRRSTCTDDMLVLPENLERKLYLKTNDVLLALGGKWDRKRKGHVFQGESAAELTADAFATGEYVDGKKEFQFFETPTAIAIELCRMAGLQDNPSARVLEPSAGHGAIALNIREFIPQGELVCVELQPAFARMLEKLGFKNVVCDDFTNLKTPLEPFDAIVMNPPFTRSQDILHIRKAFDLLKPGGRLAAVAAIGFTFRQDKKATAFREFLDEHDGSWEELPEGAFKESGTGVRTVTIQMQKA